MNALVSNEGSSVKDFFYNPYEPHNSSTDENWARGLNVESRANQDIERISANVMRLNEIYLHHPNLLYGQTGENFSLLLVDTEGHDLEVLKSNDFSQNRPALIAIEITFPSDRGLETITLDKLIHSKIHQFLLGVGYAWYGGNGFTQFYLSNPEL